MISELTGSDLGWLSAAAFAAGMVRGFSGFGSAMIYLPVAGTILSPFAALTTIVLFDLVAPLAILPKALRDAERRDIARLTAGLIVGLPLGLAILTRVPAEVFRYAVSLIAIVLLGCLISGMQYHGRLTRPMVYGTGGMSGFLMGVAGLPGPPVILFYMASPLPARVVRANTMIYLVLTDLVLLAMLAVFGRLDVSAILLGGALVVPCAAGLMVGGWLFRPERERLYRWVAYCVIAVSALSGLPLWD